MPVDFRNWRSLNWRGSQGAFGIEGCRVAQIGARYYLSYSTSSPNGVGVGLRSTADWRTVTHHGMIFTAHNKDCAIFEEKINGKYYALHRPSSPEIGGNYIWIAESPDLLHWGNHRCIAHSRPGMWDGQRVVTGSYLATARHYRCFALVRPQVNPKPGSPTNQPDVISIFEQTSPLPARAPLPIPSAAARVPNATDSMLEP